MKLILFFAGCFLIGSCSNSPLINKLEGTDSIAIKFTHAGTNEVVGTTSPGAIKALMIYIDGKQTEQYKCESDGNILFYKQGKPVGELSFNYTADGCHYFLHNVDGKPVATSMNNEAVDFFKGIAKGEK